MDKYVKVTKIYNKLKEADSSGRTIYIYAATGYGKTAAVKDYYKNTPYRYFSGIDGYIENRPDIDKITEKVIIFDDLSFLRDKTSQEYIINAVYSKKKKVVLIGRCKMPSWLSYIHIEQGFVIAEERDFEFTGDMVKIFLKIVESH